MLPAIWGKKDLEKLTVLERLFDCHLIFSVKIVVRELNFKFSEFFNLIRGKKLDMGEGFSNLRECIVILGKIFTPAGSLQ